MCIRDRAYIEQGYNIIFGTTFGYLDAMAEMAEEYPDVIFLHCSGFLKMIQTSEITSEKCINQDIFLA